MKNQPHRSNRVKRYVRSTNTKIRRIDKAYLKRLTAVPSQSILSSKHFEEKCMSEPGMLSVPKSKPELMADLAYLRDVHYNHKAGTAADPVATQRLLDELKAKGAVKQMKPEYAYTGHFNPDNTEKHYFTMVEKKS